VGGAGDCCVEWGGWNGGLLLRFRGGVGYGWTGILVFGKYGLGMGMA